MGAVIDMFPGADPDRTPLSLRVEGGVRWVGIAGPGGELLPFEGHRSPKATRALTMQDRFVTWDYGTDVGAIVRLGAMTNDDLTRTAIHYTHEGGGGAPGKPGLLAQALGLLWKQATCFEGLQQNDPTSTMESINDSMGHSVLDHRWSPNW